MMPAKKTVKVFVFEETVLSHENGLLTFATLDYLALYQRQVLGSEQML